MTQFPEEEIFNTDALFVLSPFPRPLSDLLGDLESPEEDDRGRGVLSLLRSLPRSSLLLRRRLSRLRLRSRPRPLFSRLRLRSRPRPLFSRLRLRSRPRPLFSRLRLWSRWRERDLLLSLEADRNLLLSFEADRDLLLSFEADRSGRRRSLRKSKKEGMMERVRDDEKGGFDGATRNTSPRRGR